MTNLIRALIEIDRIANAYDFISQLHRSNPMWRGKTETETGWIFRGQGDATWSLLPRAFRNTDSHPLLTTYRRSLRKQRATTNWAAWLERGIARLPSCEPAVLAEVALDALAHVEMVRRFALLADDVRHRITMPPTLMHADDEMRLEFSRYFTGDISTDAAETFAVAQHHGVPTRFLDWTYNPAVAAYFAAEESSSWNDNQEIAVWALRKDVFDFQWNLQRLTVRAGVTPFLDAQEGLFTWDVGAYWHKATAGQYRPLETLLQEFALVSNTSVVPHPLLRKLTLHVTHVPLLLKLLWRERVTPAHMMPTFDNVTRAMLVHAPWLDE